MGTLALGKGVTCLLAAVPELESKVPEGGRCQFHHRGRYESPLRLMRRQGKEKPRTMREILQGRSRQMGTDCSSKLEACFVVVVQQRRLEVGRGLRRYDRSTESGS